jgi:hypothetical protein
MTSDDTSTDQDGFFVFVGDPTAGLPPGAEVPHGHFADFFTKSRREVEHDWLRVTTQLQDVLAKVTVVSDDFALEEIQVDLGFTAEGQLAFLAKAAVESSVSMTFKRKRYRG